MFALRTKTQLTTKFSPYFLMFGREARYPSEVPKEYEITEEKVSSLVQMEEVFEGLKKQEAVFAEVKSNITKSQNKIRKKKEGGQVDNFQVGDLVLQRNKRSEQRKGGKLDADMLGPFRILNIEGKVADLATKKGKKTRRVNIDHLKHYIQPEERIPAKLQKVLDPSPLAAPLPSTPTSTPTSTTECQARGASSDVETLIRDIWSGRRRETLWAKYGPYKIYSHNLLVLAPGEELEGEIVNAYLAWVGAKAGVFILDSYLMTSLWKGTHKGSLRKLDLSKHEVAAGAVCDGAHWTLIIMYLNENRSLFLNPLGATEEQLIRCKDVTRSLVRKHIPSVGRWACTTIAHPKQMDSTSCGVLVLKLAEQILQKQQVQYPVDQEGVASMRFHMAMALVNNSDDLSELCRACGEHSIGPKVDQWVRSCINFLTNIWLEDWDTPWIGYLYITG
ncbi:uncharacterized protein [Pseudochaenichthys georgianus]|uniref:uncharacterized protein n=1 Tax=Pseudochaenichthys georgianus TaxID=52239 RepID=UPI00146A0BA6|nr:uncharacterized protein LOC117466938 [Pseudochaenichthys georgianus]XP_033966350.1 uncharacterized protein LOC117466938 [Pseudochaenichthys georgianus]